LGVLAKAIEKLRGRKLSPAKARELIAELALRSETEALDIRIDEGLLCGTFARLK
jgi:hypothetical protein